MVMFNVDHEELPFRLQVKWFVGKVSLIIELKSTGETYKVDVWHTDSQRVVVSKLFWSEIVRKVVVEDD